MIRNIPPATKYIIIINVVMYFIMCLFDQSTPDDVRQFTYDPVTYLLGLHYFEDSAFRIWQPLTYMFMHASFLHLFFNMFGMWMFGGLIERTFGTRRFVTYYLACGLGAAFCQELSQFFFANAALTVGASGALYGILLAFGMCYPEERIFVFPLPVPLKARWFVCIYVVIELWQAISNAHGSSDVAHVAHLGGMIFGWLLIKYWRGTSSQFNGWDGYEVRSGGLFSRLGQWLGNKKRKSQNNPGPGPRPSNSSWTQGKWHAASGGSQSAQQGKQHSAEIDAILEKIRRSGYDSLTEAEKIKLFEK